MVLLLSAYFFIASPLMIFFLSSLTEIHYSKTLKTFFDCKIVTILLNISFNMFLVLKRIILLRQFFRVPTIYVLVVHSYLGACSFLILNVQICNKSRMPFLSAEMFKKPLWQTVLTQIRLLLQEQSVLGPRCLLLYLIRQ